MLDPIATRLEHYMDLLSARQKLVTSNIANADTPGYHTRDINFEREFRSLMAGETPTAVEVTGLQTKNDGNNVSLDREARMLSENALRFNMASSLLKSQLTMMKTAITGGGNG